MGDGVSASVVQTSLRNKSVGPSLLGVAAFPVLTRESMTMKTTPNPFGHPFEHSQIDKSNLTDIRRLRRSPEQRFLMVGYRSRDEREIYEQMMREKHNGRSG
jgi:hypothetical protein